ncbi:MAG TPA: sulfite exporter TauE/SafE family protein [Candidatus Hydrogenedens sp.]|nr:sulfite exporter TauE/SafE family protein [Candidatus Hydrogenedens sp.]
MTSELLVFFAFLVASFVHTTTGFGSALVGMPILVFAIGLQISAPLLALLSQIVNLGVLWQNWKDLDWRHSLVLIIPSIFGVPIGLLFLKGENELLLNTVLGIILIGYGIFSFFSNELDKKNDNKLVMKPIRSHWGAIAGFIAGILGGAYNANGPPVIIYASYAHQEKGAFRSILQAFFLVNGFVIIVGHAIAGLITKDVLRYSLWGLPGLVLGMLIGFYIDRFLTPQRFRNVVVLGIILLGLALIFPGLNALIK